MSPKYIKLIVVFFVVGAVLFAVSKFDTKSKSDKSQHSLVDASELGRLKEIFIDRGERSLQLQRNDNDWLLASYHGYPADNSKVNAFLLKLSSLNTSQRVPGGAEGFAGLGLDDASIAQEKSTKVTLGNKADGQVLYLGNLRSTAAGSNPMAGQGQYVRKQGIDSAFLIAEPVSASPEFITWVQTTIINVLSAKVMKIAQYTGDLLDEKNREYQLIVTDEELTLVDGVAPGKEYNGINLNLIRGALENLRFTGVQPRASLPESVKPLHTTEFIVETGIVYTVALFQQGAEYQISVKAKFDAQAKAMLPEKKDKESQNVDEQVLMGEAAALDRKLSPWLFTIDSYIAEKFLLTKDKFIQDIGQDTAVAEPREN